MRKFIPTVNNEILIKHDAFQRMTASANSQLSDFRSENVSAASQIRLLPQLNKPVVSRVEILVSKTTQPPSKLVENKNKEEKVNYS